MFYRSVNFCSQNNYKSCVILYFSENSTLNFCCIGTVAVSAMWNLPMGLEGI